MSRVYRFHGPANHAYSAKRVLLRKRKKDSILPLRMVAADACTITDENGTRPIEEYDHIRGQRAVTLTRRECDLIALSNPGVKPPVALEDIHPWLPEQCYLNDSASSFKVLRMVVKRFSHHFVYASEYCDEKWNTICNSFRQKNGLDGRFYTAWHLPIQDVHVLEERRPERSVVSIDFNGMYLACMQQPFPKPSALKLIRLDRCLSELNVLACGLYRCILEGPKTDFIIRHNPFRSFYSGRHLRARLDEPVEIDLNEFELEYFKRHFQRIHIVDAVISEQVVPHPLAKEVRRSFAQRCSYRNHGNKILADREKYLATLMASCSHRPTRPSRTFEARDQAMVTLGAMYGIAPPEDEPEVATDIWLRGRKGINLSIKDDYVLLQGPELHDGSACFLLAQRIVARGRIALLEQMERIMDSAPNVEICYTNIDSIHFSLPTENLGRVIEWLESECSDAMGSFKIEAVTKHGLWLEPGRYWLYSDNIVKFRNRSVGNQLQPFKDHSIHVASRQLGELHVPIKVTLRMERSMSPSRTLTTDLGSGQRNQRLIEISNATTFNSVLEELEQTQRHSTPIRIAAFADLRERMNSARLAATKRAEDTDIE